MYYPYFRGKQFELSLLREQASLLAENDIHPIIEPVNDNFSPLRQTIREFIQCGPNFTIIMNPIYGDLKDNNTPLDNFISENAFNNYQGLFLGYIVKPNTSMNILRREIAKHAKNNISIIHYGYSDATSLLPVITGSANVKENIFIEIHSSQAYRRSFNANGWSNILIRDGFKIMKNADYPDDEHFSDLHLTYTQHQMNGFGDFLMVGDHFTETGGQPFAVTIHMTYLTKDNDMHIRHFISDRTETRADTPGKFQEAVNKLVAELADAHSLLYHSNACDEYIDLCNRGHFPQLGYVKKLSMQHHIELMVNFLSRSSS
jgi:hypothetical protein